jgi:hypothetical protein
MSAKKGKVFVPESTFMTEKETMERVKILERRGFDTKITKDGRFYIIHRKRR